jgi:hypothetical protein
MGELKMRRWTLVSAILLVSICGHGQKLVRGDIEYSIVTYSDEPFIDKEYAAFLDSLLNQSVFEYFRDTDITNLPTKDRDKDKPRDLRPSESHVIEPLFINVSTFSGIYAKRIWELDPKARRASRFRCGFRHQLFIISNNRYIELSSDTLKNEKLIKNLLGTGFSEMEVLKMTAHFKHRIICEHYTFLPSFYIKNDREVLFDVEKIKKSQ